MKFPRWTIVEWLTAVFIAFVLGLILFSLVDAVISGPSRDAKPQQGLISSTFNPVAFEKSVKSDLKTLSEAYARCNQMTDQSPSCQEPEVMRRFYGTTTQRDQLDRMVIRDEPIKPSEFEQDRLRPYVVSYYLDLKGSNVAAVANIAGVCQGADHCLAGIFILVAEGDSQIVCDLRSCAWPGGAKYVVDKSLFPQSGSA